MSEEDKQRVETLSNDLSEAINQEDTEKMKSLTSEIQQALMQVGNAVYSQASATGEPGSGSDSGSAETTSSSSDDDVIDADFV